MSRGRRIAIIAGAALAVAAALFFTLPIAFRKSNRGGIELTWRPPPGMELEKIAKHLDSAVPVRREGDAVVVHLPGIAASEAPDAVAMIASGGLTFREIITGETARRLIDLGLAFEAHGGPASEQPMIELDSWGGHDWYARASSKDALVTMFTEAERRGWQRPPHTVIAYARIDPREDDTSTSWRSYLVSDTPVLDGTMVADVNGSIGDAHHAVVNLIFDERGKTRFQEITASLVGKKLAVMIGGDVKSAPVIREPVGNGRAQILMGGLNYGAQERERDMLVKVLSLGSLPIGGAVVKWDYVPGEADASSMFAMLGLALAGGLVTAVVAWLLLRVPRAPRADV
jgi:hypothetical protein